MQTDRVDQSAHGFADRSEKIGTSYEKTKPDIGE